MDSGNATVQISLVRSLLEHTAALSFQVGKLAGLQDDLSRQGDFERLKGALKRHQSFVRKLYFNRMSPSGKAPQQTYFHVNDYRKALRKDYADEPRVYEELCDFVHPNYGSNYLVSSGRLGTGALDRPYSEYAAEIEFANDCVRKCLGLANGYEKTGSALLIMLDSRIELAGNQDGRPTTVFSEKGLSHTGDGSAKESATCFLKARRTLRQSK